jgi:hypothetical protein
MKKAVSAIFSILILFQFITAQEKPLTQPEYVKMLYGLQKAPGSRQDIIAALRRRGIDFALTDGIRSLTRSKGGNDEELKRALEEAGRRKQDPVAAQLPSKKETADILDNARKKTLEAVGEMPDFVVKQQIQRSAAYAGTGNFRGLDRLVVAVSYRSTGQEEYKVLSLNGVIQNNAQNKESYMDAGGTSSTGEFVTMLATIFKPASETVFEAIETDIIRGRRALVLDFSVERDKAKQQIVALGPPSNSTITGIQGKIWIDRDDFRVLRVESSATGIPADFPIRTAKRSIDYDWVKIADEKYLLPSLSDVRLTMRERSDVYETRNLIKFKEYQKFGTDITIIDDDDKPIQEEEKPKP